MWKKGFAQLLEALLHFCQPCKYRRQQTKSKTKRNTWICSGCGNDHQNGEPWFASQKSHWWPLQADEADESLSHCACCTFHWHYYEFQKREIMFTPAQIHRRVRSGDVTPLGLERVRSPSHPASHLHATITPAHLILQKDAHMHPTTEPRGVHVMGNAGFLTQPALTHRSQTPRTMAAPPECYEVRGTSRLAA